MSKILLCFALLFPVTLCAKPAPKPKDPDVQWIEGRRYVRHDLLEDITTDTAKAAAISLEKAESLKLPFFLVIDSDGGSVPAGQVISKLIAESDVPVVCLVKRHAYSMGFHILQACHIRWASKEARLMTHQPYIKAMLFSGGLQDAERLVQALANMTREVNAHNAHRLKCNLKEYEEKVIAGHEWWFSAQEALRYGAVDRIM